MRVIVLDNDNKTQSLLEHFLNRGLVISPWLMMNSQARFDASLFTVIDRMATEIVNSYWTEAEKIAVFGTFPVSERVPRTAVYEVIASTAVSLAHHQFGVLDIYHEQIIEALHLLLNFINEYGFGNTIQLYGLVTSFENAQALYYYGKMPERIFNLGYWHRPWVDYSLDDELFWGLLQGNYEIKVEDQKRYVALTQKGEDNYLGLMKILDETGYLIHRVRQLQIHNFSLYHNYANAIEEFWPNLMQLRIDFLNWSEILPGMRVLELGCGDGVSTFDAGLADLVGKEGQVTAIDPSKGMIFRANQRKQHLKAEWVTFLQARAEKLPFDNESFDAAIAFSSLHFMDLKVALQEIRRVLKPGGFFSSFHPIKFNMAANQFFSEWFSAVLKLPQFHKQNHLKDYLRHPEDVVEALKKAGYANIKESYSDLINQYKNTEFVAHHTFRGVGWAQEELSMIPWKAREDVINEVIEQGRIMCEKYPYERRVILSPMQSVKGNL